MKKRNSILMPLIGVSLLIALIGGAAWVGSKKKVTAVQNEQNVRDLCFLLLDYGDAHKQEYPANLQELLTLTNAADQKTAQMIFNESRLQMGEYEAHTNGFMFTVLAPGLLFYPGQTYTAEYSQNGGNAVLKINGKIFFQDQVKD
jgi:hypothetical protein